jgi:hypothetical protein
MKKLNAIHEAKLSIFLPSFPLKTISKISSEFFIFFGGPLRHLCVVKVSYTEKNHRDVVLIKKKIVNRIDNTKELAD